MLKTIVKKALRSMGLRVEWRDPLFEAMPKFSQLQSPYLPRVRRSSVKRILYLRDVLQQVRNVPGDFVECGTLIGYGLLNFIVLSELIGVERMYYAFDSFEGFPAPVEQDGPTHTYAGYLASPPELVLRVLCDADVSQQTIDDRVRLVRGFFSDSLPNYDGQIAILHLDCDLYQSYQDCLNELYDKVVPGGVILFDDYKDRKFPGATKAVDEFFTDKPETVELVPGWDWGWHAIKQR